MRGHRAGRSASPASRSAPAGKGSPPDGGHRRAKRRDGKRRKGKAERSPAGREESLLEVDERHDRQRLARRRYRRGVSTGGGPGSSGRPSRNRTTGPLPPSGVPGTYSGSSPHARGPGSSSRSGHWSEERGTGTPSSPPDEEAASGGRRKLVVLGVLALVVLVLCLGVGLLLARRRGAAQAFGRGQLNVRDEVSKFCGTELCSGAMSKVEGAMQSTVNPCEDFYGHACGRWAPQDSEAKSTSYLDELQKNFTSRLFHLLEADDVPRHGEATGTSMRNFYRSCVTYVNWSRSADFLNQTFNVLGLERNFWTRIDTTDHLVPFVVKLSMRTGLPSFVNMSTRNGILQIDLGTSLAASLAPMNVSVGAAVNFIVELLVEDKGSQEKYKTLLLLLDSVVEGTRRAFDRSSPFHFSRFKNTSEKILNFYKAALDNAGAENRQMMSGLILVRGIDEISGLASAAQEMDSQAVALYSAVVVASKMIGYELQRRRHWRSGDATGEGSYEWNRRGLKLWCVHVVEEHFKSDFLEWAAEGIQSRYAVEKARKVTESIIDRLAKTAPPEVADKVRPILESTQFNFYADPNASLAPPRSKISTEYIPYDFFGNIVRHALSPDRDVVRWSPQQYRHGLEPTGIVGYRNELHILVAPAFLMEDFFYPESGEPSLNFATFGTFVIGLLMRAAEKLQIQSAVEWKDKITECLAANAELFGWTGRDWSGRDLEYELALRLAVAYEAEWATLRAVEEHDSRDRFFFRRFALMQCSASASDALRRSLDFAVRHVPRFDEVFNCKPQGFKNCFSSYGT